MCGRLGILCTACPAVLLGELDILGAHADHGFDSDYHTFFQEGTRTRDTIVGNIGAFVHLETDAMTAKLTNYRIAILFAVLLDSMADIANTIPFLALIESDIESLFGDFEKTLHLRRDFATGEGVGRIAYIAVQLDDTVKRYIVAFVEIYIVAGDAMDNDIIDRDTQWLRLGEYDDPPQPAFYRRGGHFF